MATDALLDHVDERRDVVIGDSLPLGHRGRIHGGAFPDEPGVGFGDDPELRLGLDRQELNFEPCGIARLVAEQAGHGLEGVTGDQGNAPPCRNCTRERTVPRPCGAFTGNERALGQPVEMGRDQTGPCQEGGRCIRRVPSTGPTEQSAFARTAARDSSSCWI